MSRPTSFAASRFPPEEAPSFPSFSSTRLEDAASVRPAVSSMIWA